MTAIPPGEYAQRADKLRSAAAKEGFDAVLAFSNAKSQANVRWLTSYYTRFVGWQHVEGSRYAMFGSCACLLPVEGEPVVRSDQTWDLPRVQEMSVFADADSTVQLGADLGRTIRERGYRRVAVDNWHIFPAEHYLRLMEQAPDVELVDSRIISEARRVKSSLEIGLLRRVEEIADAAVQAGMDAVRVGATEYEVALVAEAKLRELGDLEPAGSSIIGTTRNAATGVCIPSREKVIERGEWVLFDVLPKYEGYAGDIARMRLAGDLDDLAPELRHLFDATLLMNREVIEAIRPGISPKELNEIADAVARQENVAEYKSPLLGHATGIDIHDIPDFWSDESPLEPGEVITIEPCLGVPGVAGTRIEDVVLVTEDGHDVLTKTPRGLTAE